MNTNVIEAKGLTKQYKLYDKPVDRLKEALHFANKKYHKKFTALDHLDFQVQRGECLGIIGKNGSGKSTLLKMITGVLTPTSGSLHVEGSISALLELGAGFNPELTGLENVFLNGTIMGFSRDEMQAKLDEILEFADIGEFIHQPVKTYSSGMFVRLAFAVAINVDPDILIVDEALSVGDLRFQQKCYRKIDELKQTKTILFVTHDMSVINKYCDRVVWINEGKLIEEGQPKEISKKYQAFMIGANFGKLGLSELPQAGKQLAGSSKAHLVDPLQDGLDMMGDEKAVITGISMYESGGQDKVTLVEAEQEVEVLIRLNVMEAIDNPIVGFSMKDRLGNVIFQTNSYILGSELQSLQPGEGYVFSFSFQFPSLNHGAYTISPAIASGTQQEHKQHSWVHDALVVEVLPLGYESVSGILCLKDVSFSAIV
ncbi:ABC transporter ATP-binding protein [Paenibacillus sp. JJ-223]|uniref:ABC transporter ATP-binding protein n=1 Tax=Paenibacillus sp. JJ-223 TaxID=2905647 RepID=UPI001F47503A|nr:ABC transporter ATP-binding protein [Paenibacillus sp. JJ-223]CAH1223476.1 Vitamin B12 import ATP-binding protein BtuD [Paenibacillus sp. JJ-223]